MLVPGVTSTAVVARPRDRRRPEAVSRHRAYGLRIEANEPVPGLPDAEFAGEADVYIEFGFIPHVSQVTEVVHDPDSPAAANPFVRVTRVDGLTLFTYRDATRFAIDGSGSHVWVEWPPELTIEDATTYLLGPILGFILRLRGTVSIHASCVTLAGRGVAFVGDAGAGKSTIAAAFAADGDEVITDDVLALEPSDEGTISVFPAYPRVRLWKESAEGLFGFPESLPRIVPTHPTWDKRFLTLNEAAFAESPRLLGAIYILGPREGEPSVSTIAARDALVALIRNSYVTYLLDAAMRKRDFEVLSRVLTTVPVRTISTGEAFSDLASFRDLVRRDCAGLFMGARA